MMTNMLFTGLVNIFTKSKTRQESNMMTWAKTEYGNDWQFAYQCMLDTGMPPSDKDIRGMIL